MAHSDIILRVIVLEVSLGKARKLITLSYHGSNHTKGKESHSAMGLRCADTMWEVLSCATCVRVWNPQGCWGRGGEQGGRCHHS